MLSIVTSWNDANAHSIRCVSSCSFARVSFFAALMGSSNLGRLICRQLAVSQQFDLPLPLHRNPAVLDPLGHRSPVDSQRLRRFGLVSEMLKNIC